MNYLPPLTLLHNEEALRAHYFSTYANWLIPNKVMIGENPASVKSSIRKRIKALCKRAGCTTFVCLQSEIPPQTHQALMMGGYTDWKKNASLKMLPSYYYHVAKAVPNETPNYIHYGMRDESEVHSLNDLKALMEELKGRINLGEVLYIHCDDGTERTKLFAAGLLGWLYSEMSVEEAVERTDEYCEMRNQRTTEFFPPRVKCTSIGNQKEDVDELLSFRRMASSCSKEWGEESKEERTSKECKEEDSNEFVPFSVTSLDVESQNEEIRRGSMSLLSLTYSLTEELDVIPCMKLVDDEDHKDEVIDQIKLPILPKVNLSTNVKSREMKKKKEKVCDSMKLPSCMKYHEVESIVEKSVSLNVRPTDTKVQKEEILLMNQMQSPFLTNTLNDKEPARMTSQEEIRNPMKLPACTRALKNESMAKESDEHLNVRSPDTTDPKEDILNTMQLPSCTKSLRKELIVEELKDQSIIMKLVDTEVQEKEVPKKKELIEEESKEIKILDGTSTSTGDLQEKEVLTMEQLSLWSKLPLVETSRNEESKDDLSVSKFKDKPSSGMKSKEEELFVEETTDINSPDGTSTSTGDLQETEVLTMERLSTWPKLPPMKKLRNDEPSSISIKSQDGPSTSIRSLPSEPLVVEFTQVCHSTRVQEIKSKLRFMEERYRGDSLSM